MAKMFYTLDEAAQKLGKSPEEVKEMAKSGQLQEFRDRDKLMFKVEQVDLLAGGDEAISLEAVESEDLDLGSPASGSASGIGLVDSREDTGISVFDTSHGDANDTHVTETVQEEELSLESVGSGSGLLDLTRESDDTSLGAELLEEVYSSDDEGVEMPAHASGLFESAGAESPGDTYAEPASVAVGTTVVEPYDGSGSGLGAGLMIGAFVALVLVALVVFVGLTGTTPGLVAMAANVWMYAGILLVAVAVMGAIGWFVGRASE